MDNESFSKDTYAEKLLAVAAHWRRRADGMTDPYYGDVMRRAAEGLEQAARRAEMQAFATP